ncbi:hypothetical protein V6N12_045692 [Hibiscus sabdariffa]|uniref:Uncharacterized protein n=1 Tax=Hibiscus sabdariffa TaxID=183260 RepID=A0ABR2G3I8_9ROSI
MDSSSQPASVSLPPTPYVPVNYATSQPVVPSPSNDHQSFPATTSQLEQLHQALHSPTVFDQGETVSSSLPDVSVTPQATNIPSSLHDSEAPSSSSAIPSLQHTLMPSLAVNKHSMMQTG